jgi:alpha-L-rhamnosidase
MKLNAKWIWKKQNNYKLYNQTIIAKKSFQLGKISSGTIRITADSYYRLFINGQWLNDGPCRSYPEHFQYDEIDVTPQLRQGINEIRIVARYYGCGTFHQIPQQAGLLVQLDIKLQNGASKTIISDESWEIAEAKAWISNTCKDAVNFSGAEYYDARKETLLRFGKAAVLFDADGGPWKKLNPRDVALLTRQPVAFKSLKEANIVTAKGKNFCINALRLTHPGLIKFTKNTSLPFAIATTLKTKSKCTINIDTKLNRDEGLKITIDGKHNPNGKYVLAKGVHLVLGFMQQIYNNDKEAAVRFLDPEKIQLENPLDPKHENPWCFVLFPQFLVKKSDLFWRSFRNDDPEIATAQRDFTKLSRRIMKKVHDKESFLAELGSVAQCMPSEKMFVEEYYWKFLNREVIDSGDELVRNRTGSLYENNECTTIKPTSKGDVELLYDLGEQNCGHYAFEIMADAGVDIDIYGVEHIDEVHGIQHTRYNRNGMRYTTRQGLNSFISTRRRSGRFIFMTLRNQKTSVKIRKFELIESTYPVEYIGNFSCSDTKLDKIWDISARTLKLCMEDVFTDCPLYEQTYWVGDARNEAVFAYTAFGAYDVSKRCLNIAAQSLEHFPIVGCQVPSSWEVLLPAWSFLWGIAVWEYYWQTGDVKYLKNSWKAVIKNLKGAESMMTDGGLFSATFWNLFDWAPTDYNHKTVLHNSMFVVGAINSALDCAKAIGDKTYTSWLNQFRKNTVAAINKVWDDNKNAYPDSIHDDGTISPAVCQHTSFLSVLYNIVEKKNDRYAQNNVLNPSKNMVRVSSPFAIMYLYETLEKMGRDDDIIKSVYENYTPMLEADATTVWEVFPTSNERPQNFPTKSHCHAWSSAPVYFLNKIVLGIKQTKPAAKAFEISPRLNRLEWAKGTTATINGPVSVQWRVDGKTLNVKISAPKNVRCKFVKNETHKGLRVVVNGK